VGCPPGNGFRKASPPPRKLVEELGGLEKTKQALEELEKMLQRVA
jgi:hypothetical protein